MSGENQNQVDPLRRFGSLCKQLITMCQKSRNQRVADRKPVKRLKTIPSGDLTHLNGTSSILNENEQNPHEGFYRQHYENLEPSA